MAERITQAEIERVLRACKNSGWSEVRSRMAYISLTNPKLDSLGTPVS